MLDRQRVSAWFAAQSDTRIALAIGIVGFLLVSPSLGLGLAVLDDVQQQAFVLAKVHGAAWAANRPWYDVYNLIGGDATLAYQQRFQGLVPWWMWPPLKVQFFRPLAAAALYLDYGVFGSAYWLAHLHSALWYFAACYLVALVCLRLSRERAAAVLGAVFYAGDDAHVSPATWLAGRNAIIAVVFVAGSLLLFDAASKRERDRDSLRLGAGALLCFVCALLAAENAISALPLFLAHALLLDRRSPARRALAFGSVLFTVLGWLALHHLLGFGAHGSASYINPVSEFATFWSVLPARWAALVHAQLMAPWGAIALVPFGVLAWAEWFSAYVLVPMLCVLVARRADRDPELAFWALAAVLGLVPLAAADPHERLLTHVSIAFCMVIGTLVLALLRAVRESRAWCRPLAAIGALGILGTHAVLSPLALALGCFPPRDESAPWLATHELDRDAELAQHVVVLINVPYSLTPGLMVAERHRLGLALPASVVTLGVTVHEVEVTRVDAHTIELYTPPGYLLDELAHWWRGSTLPLRQGERINTRDYEAQVLRLTPDERPLRVRFRFKHELDDPRLHFVYWSGKELRVFAFAPLMQRKVIPATFDHSSQKPEELVR